MRGLFYIIEVRPQWYNLCLSDNHYCVACGSDIEILLGTVYKYIRKYKNSDRLHKVISDSFDSDISEVFRSETDKRKSAYTRGRHLQYEELVDEVVERALKDNRADSPILRARRIAKKGVSPTAKSLTGTPTPVQCDTGHSIGLILPRKVVRTPLTT